MTREELGNLLLSDSKRLKEEILIEVPYSIFDNKEKKKKCNGAALKIKDVGSAITSNNEKITMIYIKDKKK